MRGGRLSGRFCGTIRPPQEVFVTTRLTAFASLLASALWFSSMPSDAASAPVSGLYASGAQGNATVFAANNSLLLINEATGAGTPVCVLAQAGTEVVWDRNGSRAFQQAPDGTFTIVQFDAGTCGNVSAPVADSHSFTGLEFVGSTLYGAGIDGGGGNQPSTLYTLNPVTGVPTAVGPTGVSAPMAGLAYDPGSATMYGISGGPAASLYRINIATGAATLVGSSGIQAGSLEFGLTGTLFAGGTGQNGGNLYSMNTATGAATLIGATGLPNVTGLMLVTVGVPTLPVWSMLALAAALLLLGVRAVRLRRA
jgi:hypothetical protein